jgi:hypothetical protein
LTKNISSRISSDSLFSFKKTYFWKKEFFFENFKTSENNITGVELAKVLGYLV